jgi:hypothetical protein
MRKFWWRRRELNPRPKKPAVQSLRVYPALLVQRLPKEPAKRQPPSPINLGPWLRTEALVPILQNDTC